MLIPLMSSMLAYLSYQMIIIFVGVHFGVKKMYSIITSRFYWRTLYVDIGNFCRRCEKCTEVAVSGHRDSLMQEDTDDQGDENAQKVTTLPTDRVIRVWKKVSLEFFTISIFFPF